MTEDKKLARKMVEADMRRNNRRLGDAGYADHLRQLRGPRGRQRPARHEHKICWGRTEDEALHEPCWEERDESRGPQSFRSASG
jgi:hypothetical protein